MFIILPLSITLAVETIIYLSFFRFSKKIFIITSISNIVLNVAMNFGLFYVNDQIVYWTILSLVEITTVVIESLVIFVIGHQKYLKSLLVSLAANVTSFLIGLAFFLAYEMRITPIVVACVFFFIYLLEFVYTFFLHSYFFGK